MHLKLIYNNLVYSSKYMGICLSTIMQAHNDKGDVPLFKKRMEVEEEDEAMESNQI